MTWGEEDLLYIPFKRVIVQVYFLPILALVACFACSVFLHYPQAVATSCGATNWLPSVSSVVATFVPETYIWRLLIGIHSGPRIALALAFRNFLLYSPLRPLSHPRLYGLAVRVSCGMNLLETVLLLAMAAVSTGESAVLHSVLLWAFEVCGVVWMLLSTTLFASSGRRRSSVQGQQSYEYKVLLCTGSVVSLVLAIYFAIRHYAYCESGVHTIFAIFEFAVLACNILYQSTFYLDFQDKVISLGAAVTFGSAQYQHLSPVDKDH